MKIALIMTGHMKGWQRCYEGIVKNILSQHDVDIYISTWDVDNTGRHENADAYPPAMTKPVIDLYKPKKIHIENHNQYHANRFPKIEFVDRPDDVFKVDAHAMHHGSYWVERMRDMWYIIKQGYLLIDNPQEYDLIMRLRFDIVFDSINIQPTDVPVFLYVNEAGREAHDLFCYGPPDHMKVYAHFFDHIEPLYKNHNLNIAHSDLMLGKYLMDYNNIIPKEDRSITYHVAYKN